MNAFETIVAKKYNKKGFTVYKSCGGPLSGKGMPDFFMVKLGKKLSVLLVEAKSNTAKPSADQKKCIKRLLKIGMEALVVGERELLGLPKYVGCDHWFRDYKASLGHDARSFWKNPDNLEKLRKHIIKKHKEHKRDCRKHIVKLIAKHGPEWKESALKSKRYNPLLFSRQELLQNGYTTNELKEYGI